MLNAIVGRDPAHPGRSYDDEAMSGFVETNVLVRHLAGDPPEMAARATAYLAADHELLLTDLVAAETVHILESFYEAPRDAVARAMRSLVAFEAVVCVDPSLLLRAVWRRSPVAARRGQRARW